MFPSDVMRILCNVLFVFSNRYGRWHKDKQQEASSRNISRVIVFMLGGLCHSEARAGYEVSRAGWEVVVGGDTPTLTPAALLASVQARQPKQL